jgi:NhaP-type Na+/H+ or K+/H+ antiporter
VKDVAMVDFQLGLLIALLALAVPLVALAKYVDVSYPIAPVIGGFVPGLPKIQFDPNLVLLIFLTPLLYWEAITAPTDIMWENAGHIAVLAVGLVIATTVAVALLAHAIVPGMSWGRRIHSRRNHLADR